MHFEHLCYENVRHLRQHHVHEEIEHHLWTLQRVDGQIHEHIFCKTIRLCFKESKDLQSNPLTVC